jgi:hypothetical protein
LYRAISQETSAAVNRKKKQRSYTSYTLKQEKQEQKQRLNPTYMNILSDIYVISANDKLPAPIQPLEVIRRDCGELCNTSRDGSPGPYFNHVTAQVNCPALFKNAFIDRSVTISLAPASKTQASTQGFSEPITKTHPLLTPGACCNPSLKAFVSGIP